MTSSNETLLYKKKLSTLEYSIKNALSKKSVNIMNSFLFTDPKSYCEINGEIDLNFYLCRAFITALSIDKQSKKELF